MLQGLYHSQMGCDFTFLEEYSLENPHFQVAFQRKPSFCASQFRLFSHMSSLQIHQMFSLTLLSTNLHNQVFDENVLQLYNVLFCALIKIRHLDRVMKQKWKSINRKILLNFDNPQNVQQQIQLIRHRINYFLKIYQQYIYLQVIEHAHQKLLVRIPSCTSLPGLKRLVS